jgi:DNA-binding response OmpR family regulator
METLLLIGPDSPEIRRLKGTLLKHGFQAKFVSAEELERLHEKESRFALGLVETGKSERLQDLVQKVRSNSSCKELPLMALIRPDQLRELGTAAGLEDFLIFPADPEMIEARVRFVLSRLNHFVPGAGKRFGALEINVDRYEVLLGKEPLELTYKEFELLKFLATHPGRVFSRDQLLNQVWGYNFIGGTRTVDVHVRRLRAKLGPKYAALIDTVRNVGYKFLESL